MKSLEERKAALASFKERHASDIPAVLRRSIKLMLEQFGGQMHAARHATETLGYPVTQGTISKDLEKESGLWRVYTTLTLVSERLGLLLPYTSWTCEMNAQFPKRPQVHQLCSVIESQELCFVRMCYMYGDEVRVIVNNKEGKEMHYSPSALEFMI